VIQFHYKILKTALHLYFLHTFIKKSYPITVFILDLKKYKCNHIINAKIINHWQMKI